MFQRLRVVLSYEPGAGFAGPMAASFGGLCNQLYTHVGMLGLALQSGSDVVRACFMRLLQAAKEGHGGSSSEVAITPASDPALCTTRKYTGVEQTVLVVLLLMHQL